MKLGKWTIRSPIKRETGMYYVKLPAGVDEDCCGGYIRLSECPEIQTPVNRISDLISSMTVLLMENKDIGDVRIKNGLSRMVDITPNKYLDHREFYNIIVKTMLLGDGNAVVLPVTKDGLLLDLIPLNMGHVAFIDNPDGYGYTIRYKNQVYQPDDVLHFRINPDVSRPWIGTGYKVLLNDIAQNLHQAQKTKKKFMQSPKPSLVVKVDGLTEEFSSKEGRAKLRDEYISDTEDGAPWMIPAAFLDVHEVKPLSLNDIAINDNVALDKRTAAAIFGVPPFFVGVGEFKKEEYNNFINMIIMPLAKSIEQELTRKLLLDPNWFFKFNVRSLYAYDLSELISAGRNMVDRMAMDRNEWRDWIGLTPRNDMKEILGLENFIPARKLGAQKKLKQSEEGEAIGE